LLSSIGTVVAADLYQIVQNMFVSVQYERRNLGNAYAVSEPYYGYNSGTSDCRSVSDQLQHASKDTEDQYHVTTEFELCDGGYNW